MTSVCQESCFLQYELNPSSCVLLWTLRWELYLKWENSCSFTWQVWWWKRSWRAFVSAQTTGSDWESIRAHCGLSTSRTINTLAAAARPTFTSYSRLTAESVWSRIKRQREKASGSVWWFHAEAIRCETVTAAPFSSVSHRCEAPASVHF